MAHISALEKHHTAECRSSSGGFDCNICLDDVVDPVVTICGHLYCWPCIYKWIHQQRTDDADRPQCPVCKSQVSEKSLIPLYGRGQSDEEVAGVVPHRPKGPARVMSQRGYGYRSAPDVSLRGSMVISMLICAAGVSEGYPDSYGVVYSAGSGRGRRNARRADESLTRLSFFMCCCLVWCLVFF